MLGKLNMLFLDVSTNIQTWLEIIVNIWFGPGPGDFGQTLPRPRCFYGPGRSLYTTLHCPYCWYLPPNHAQKVSRAATRPHKVRSTP